jgi:catechol O-methyltransferase
MYNIYNRLFHLGMPKGIASWRFQLQSVALILLSLVFLPLSTFVFLVNYARRPLPSFYAARRQRIRRRSSFHPKTIMVTGIGSMKGLAVARCFYEAGHDVIGADFEPYGVPVGGRFSRSLRKFYSLAQPNAKDGLTYYLHHLLRIIQREKVDLWVSCSGVASALEDAQAKEVVERRSGCVAIQFDVVSTSTLQDRRTFIQRTAELGLPAPETYNVTSRTAIHKILHSPAASRKKYIMQSVEADDIFRDMTVLPRRTMSETYGHISAIPISSARPWLLQEYIRGQEYSTHALVIQNVVKAFVACPSPKPMHYEALPPQSALGLAMRSFTQEFATRSPSGMTGHLNFKFIVEEVVSEKGLHSGLRALECDTRAHAAMILLADHSQELAEAYVSALPINMNGGGHLLEDHDDSFDTAEEEIPDQNIITPPQHPPKFHWIGHDIITLLFFPLLQPRQFSASGYMRNIMTLLQHLFFWTDAVFVSWDPLPWWWLYQVYWPGIFLISLWTGRKWSRVDVSTGEVYYS